MCLCVVLYIVFRDGSLASPNHDILLSRMNIYLIYTVLFRHVQNAKSTAIYDRLIVNEPRHEKTSLRGC